MSNLAALSLVLALISAVLAFTGLLGTAYWLGRAGFLVFLLVFVVTAAVAAVRGRAAQ